MPESPRWLLRRGEYTKLKKALAVLGIQASEDQLKEAAAEDTSSSPAVAHLTPGVKRALMVAGVFMVFQQITGINVPFYYGPKILEPYFSSGHITALRQAVTAIEATLVLATVNIAATYIGFRYIDSYGRQAISRLGFLGMALFMAFSTLALITLPGRIKALILVVCLAGFIAFFAFGVGGTGWIIEGEYFPTEVRGRMAATVAFINWLANFSIIELFPVLKHALGLPGVMGIFAVLSVLAVVFVSRWMPETKGLSVEEIAARFDRAAKP